MLRATAHAPPGVVQRERHVATVAFCAGMLRLEHLLHEAGGSLCVPAAAAFSCFRVGGALAPFPKPASVGHALGGIAGF